MPVALIEAQLAGIPVIATDVGSNAEVIENNTTGIVTSKVAIDLVHAVARLIDEKQLLVRMGKAASTKAIKKFSVKKMLETHKRAYGELMK
jgi:glycosyltransferase involved in cell wall biosynthesis